MRNDRAAKERRQQRAQERMVPVPPPKIDPPKYPTPDTPEAMLRFAASLGWNAKRTRDGYRFTHPSGATASMHLTVSDKAAWRNLRCQILRPTRQADKAMIELPSDHNKEHSLA